MYVRILSLLRPTTHFHGGGEALSIIASSLARVRKRSSRLSHGGEGLVLLFLNGITNTLLPVAPFVVPVARTKETFTEQKRKSALFYRYHRNHKTFTSSPFQPAPTPIKTTPINMQHRSITLVLLLLLNLFQVTLAQDEFGTMDATKTAWPELVGENGQAAMATIKQATGFSVQVVPDGAMVTMDFREDRVRIFVDTDENVARPPRVG